MKANLWPILTNSQMISDHFSILNKQTRTCSRGARVLAKNFQATYNFMYVFCALYFGRMPHIWHLLVCDLKQAWKWRPGLAHPHTPTHTHPASLRVLINKFTHFEIRSSKRNRTCFVSTFWLALLYAWLRERRFSWPALFRPPRLVIQISHLQVPSDFSHLHVSSDLVLKSRQTF